MLLCSRAVFHEATLKIRLVGIVDARNPDGGAPRRRADPTKHEICGGTNRHHESRPPMNDTCAGHQQYRQCHQLRVESRRRRIRRGRRFCQSVALDHSGQLGLVVDSRGGVLEPTPRSIDEFGQLGLDDVEPSQTLVVESDGTRKIGRRCLGRGSLVVEFPQFKTSGGCSVAGLHERTGGGRDLQAL